MPSGASVSSPTVKVKVPVPISAVFPSRVSVCPSTVSRYVPGSLNAQLTCVCASGGRVKESASSRPSAESMYTLGLPSVSVRYTRSSPGPSNFVAVVRTWEPSPATSPSTAQPSHSTSSPRSSSSFMTVPPYSSSFSAISIFGADFWALV